MRVPTVMWAVDRRISMDELQQRFRGLWNFFKNPALACTYLQPARVVPARNCAAGAFERRPNMTEKMKSDPVPEAPDAVPTEQVPDWLSGRLRRMFTDVMDEPVPDEFKALLKQLEDKERGP